MSEITIKSESIYEWDDNRLIKIYHKTMRLFIDSIQEKGFDKCSNLFLFAKDIQKEADKRGIFLDY